MSSRKDESDLDLGIIIAIGTALLLDNHEGQGPYGRLSYAEIKPTSDIEAEWLEDESWGGPCES